MKLLVFGLLVALATAAPAPMSEPSNDAVEVIVNGLAEGEPLEIGDIVDVKLKQTIDGDVVAVNNLLQPFTAEGIAQSAAEQAQQAAPAIDQPAIEEPSINQPAIEEPSIIQPAIEEPSIDLPAIEEVAVETDLEPQPIAPIVPVVPAVPVFPAVPEVPAVPELVPENVEESEHIPASIPQIPSGEVYNDGLVQVSINPTEDAGVLATVQSWLSMAINYFSNGVQTTQQII